MKNPVVDKDLTQLLKQCEAEELETIVGIILSSPSQTLTVQPGYREHQGNHLRYVDEIVYEITSFGGNSLANLVRGQGIPYAEMVRDVAGKLGIKPALTDTVPTLEGKILLKIIKLAYDRLNEEDRLALQELLELGDGLDEAGEFSEEEIGRQLATAGTSLLGDRIQNAIGVAARSAKFRQAINGVLKAGIAKLAMVSLGGPVSWAVAAGQALYDLFGPNYTTAIGLIAQIGLLRQKYEQLGRDMVAGEVEASVTG